MIRNKKLLFILISMYVGSLYVAYASLSGDGLCGASATTACTATHLVSLIKKVLVTIITFALPIIVAIIAIRFLFAWKAAYEGNPNAYREAAKKAWESFIAFLIFVVLATGGVVVLFEALGASPYMIKIFELIKNAFIPTAYAQASATLPTPTTNTDLYTFLLKVLSLTMSFFIYPALILIWIGTGFSFVFAQGSAEKLKKAKMLLVFAVVTTLVIVLIQTFLLAAKGTVEEIMGKQIETTQTTQTTPMFGASCTLDNGNFGVRGVNGECYPSQGEGSNSATYCNGKPIGTVCTIGTSVQGICKKDTVVGCFRGTQGESCISNGKDGTIDASGNCFIRESGIGRGGSCRIQDECQSGLLCHKSVCLLVGDSCTKSDGNYGRLTTSNLCQ